MSAYSDLLLSTSPVAYWRLGESAGTAAVDATGNGHNGTYTNGPTLGQPGLIVDTDTAVLFDGVNDHVAVPQNPALQITGALTVQAWIMWNRAEHGLIVFDGTNAPIVRLYGLAVNADGSAEFNFYDGTAFRSVRTPAGVLVPGNTYHVAGTRDAGMFHRLYVDGVQRVAGQLVGTPAGTPTMFAVGQAGYGSSFFPGIIDEVAVHNYALTPEQIADLYDLGANGPPPPPPPSGGGTPRPARRYHRMGRGVTR